MATTYGLPIGNGAIRTSFKKLIAEHNLPPVVFHSLRHTSVTYKLKLNGVDAEFLSKVLANPEMAALLTSLAKTMK